MRNADRQSAARREPRFQSLRGRVVLAFALSSSLVSLVLVISVFAIGRGYMESQRSRAVERLARAHAELLHAHVTGPDQSGALALSAVHPPEGNVLLLWWNSEWFDTDPGFMAELLRTDSLPSTEQSEVERTSVAGRHYLRVGVALDGNGNLVYEFAPIDELESNLRMLRNLLVAGACVATAIGAANGAWASRRVLKPLRQVAGTASRIASGELDLRLPQTRDHELATTVDAFNSMVDSLQQRIGRERRLVGDIGHELRSPLTTLVTGIEVLNRYHQQLSQRPREALRLVGAEVEHLRGLLDDLLALARVEAGIHGADAEELSVAALLTHTLAGRQYPLELLTVDEDIRISGRKLELERAIANLLENADRHGGGVVAVHLHCDGKDSVITVDDAGPGVPAEHRVRIFERFATVRTSRRSTSGAGTGIGLALVAETVTAHGGRVECAHRPGGGARFSIRLPRIE
ncbi:sensor histidine kinase [Nocardia sp. CA-084685]|uniref:sensor histidine kinase n=1 Tax=Nocardia sp. CA-084685 TaxID=3239970 RepID=UPI003D96830E